MTKLTAAKQVKAAGLKSLKWLAETAGVHPQQLDRWSKDRPKLFDLIICGALYKQGVSKQIIVSGKVYTLADMEAGYHEHDKI